jgi:hypothetical protein
VSLRLLSCSATVLSASTWKECRAESVSCSAAWLICQAREGENQEELEMIAIDDQFMAQNGYVPLRQGNKVWHVHIDELTCLDRPARLEYEKTLVQWLRLRVEFEKLEAEFENREEEGRRTV